MTTEAGEVEAHGATVVDLRAPDEAPARESWSGPARGSTVILPRVVERIAAQAVREVSGAAGTGPRVLGLPVGTPRSDGAPTVHADVDGPVATLEVEMAVVYPAPVLDVARRVRQRILERIGQLTGLRVRRLDIAVVTMRVESPEPRVR